jgi:hypothetical protein
MCLDWILASTEYIEFVSMMLEFKVRHFKSIFFSTPKTGWMMMSNKKRRMYRRKTSDLYSYR